MNIRWENAAKLTEISQKESEVISNFKSLIMTHTKYRWLFRQVIILGGVLTHTEKTNFFNSYKLPKVLTSQKFIISFPFIVSNLNIFSSAVWLIHAHWISQAWIFCKENNHQLIIYVKHCKFWTTETIMFKIKQ